MKTRKILMAAGLMAVAASVQAIPFNNTTGAPAVATVGTGGDYATLAAAATAFNTVAGGINRPWTLEILNDLVEPANVAIANTFGVDGSLTIKPAASTTPKITFEQTAGPAGTAFFGHFVIGSYAIGPVGGPDDVPNTTNTIPSNGKYTIDGSNTVGGTTRDLTFAVGETTALASGVNNIIRIVGDSDGVVVKNTNFIFNDTAGSYAAIGLGGGVIDSVNVIPDNCVIENNDFQIGQLTTGTGANGFAIQTTVAATGSVAAGTGAVQGLIVRDNDMVIKQRGIFMNGVGSATIERNNITLANTASGFSHAGIFHFTSNGVTGWTQIYDSNVVSAESAVSADGGNGAQGILADSGPTTGTYIVTNNIVKGNFLTNPTPIDGLVRAMSFASVTSNYTIEHNSVSVPDSAANGTTAARVYALGFPLALTTGTATINNNIVRMGEVDGTSSAIRLAATTGITMAGNTIFTPAGGRIGRNGTTDIANFADWQTAGFDSTASGGQNVDPLATSPAWDADLKFASEPITGLTGVAASTVLVDIDGDTRPATGAIPGADQPPQFIASDARNWNLYE